MKVQAELLLRDSVAALPGIGKARLATLAEADLRTVYDLLTYAPVRHEDRSRFVSVAQLEPGRPTLLHLTVVSARLIRTRRRDFIITEAYLRDHSGTVKTLWYNRPYLARGLTAERRLVVFGEAGERSAGLTLENPDYELLDADDVVAGGPHWGRIVPIYRRLKTMSPKALRKLMWETLAAVKPDRTTEDGALIADLRLLHFPQAPEDVAAARQRLSYQELLEFQTGLALCRRSGSADDARPAPVTDASAALQSVRPLAPFPLTSAQSKALTAILSDMAGPRPMARLLHGEVGAGKTMVALLSAVPVLETGRQVAILAPTEVLARQLYDRAVDTLLERGRLPVSIELLSRGRKGGDRARLLVRVAQGDARLVVGTHALFQDRVAWRDLAYVVVDEQHRFGVFERRALLAKAHRTPDLLVMSATPIPRTLTLTMYGDLEVSRMAEVPPGRRPVTTSVLSWKDRAEAYAALEAAVARHEQGFVVVLRIEDDEKRQRSSVRAIVDAIREKRAGWRVGVLHGRLEPDEKAAVVERMRRGLLDVVVATTVVEVGVDVPRASVMIVLGAESYGLSQLHQLRGRTGRSEIPGQCFFVLSRHAPAGSIDRVRPLQEIADGFRVAELDWQGRGPGDIGGARQWGSGGFRMAELQTMAEQLDRARSEGFRGAAGMSKTEAAVALARWQARFGLARIA